MFLDTNIALIKQYSVRSYDCHVLVSYHEFLECWALSCLMNSYWRREIESIIGLRCRQRNPNPVCIRDRCLTSFLTYGIINCYLLSVGSFIFDILRRITNFSERYLLFLAVVQKWRHDVTINVACELSQPMGKTDFSSTAKNSTNSGS